MVSLGIIGVDGVSDLKTDDIIYIYRHIASILFGRELVNGVGHFEPELKAMFRMIDIYII
jgi:hypothetical protein